MRIETIMYMTHDEFTNFIKESDSHNKWELKDYLKYKFDIQTDFCAKVEEFAGEDYGSVVYNVIPFGKGDE